MVKYLTDKIDQLIVDFVVQRFVAVQVTYSRFYKIFLWKQQPAAARNSAIRAARFILYFFIQINK